jgi:S1-C subfamily serine protease
VNGLDVFLVGLALAAAIGGYRLGFVTRVASWVGMLVGVGAAATFLPWLVRRFGNDVQRPSLVLLCGGLLIAGGLAGQTVGLIAGSKLHLAIPRGPARRVDAVVGAAAGVLGLALITWLLAPAMADVPQWPAREARGSAVVGAIDRVLPAPPNTTRSLRRVLGEHYPDVFDALDPSPTVGPPPPASGLSQATADRITTSTVKVVGQACDRIQEGTGFVVAPDLVATNAHVVAGEQQTALETSDGARHRGQVVAFDPERDIALVSVPGLGRAPLPLADVTVGARGAVFGHPGGGPLRLAPFRVAQRIAANGSDIYDRPGATRQVLVLASSLRPGDSGSALVGPDGTVVGVAFAIAPDRPNVAYALDPSELRAVLAAPHATAVNAGACIA